MTSAIRRFIALMLVLVAVVVLAVPAGAQGPDKVDLQDVRSLLDQIAGNEDPQQAFDSLPYEARRAIAKALLPGRIEIEIETPPIASEFGSSMAASSDPCGTHKVTAKYWDGSILIWSYWSQTEWCWNGQIITSHPEFSYDGKVHSHGPDDDVTWRFVANSRYKKTGGKGSWEFTDRIKGHFEGCGDFDLGDLGTIEICFPEDVEIMKYQYGSGSSDSTIDW